MNVAALLDANATSHNTIENERTCIETIVQGTVNSIKVRQQIAHQ
jgi:hypothetical protein